MRNVWKIIRWPLFLLVAYVGGILLYGTFTDWQPTGTATLGPSGGQTSPSYEVPDSIITLTTWNVGFGGMGAEDYFYYNRGDFFWTDLGKARAARENVDRYVAGQEQTLATTQSDFFLLQEVDTASRRSYYTNQLALDRAALPDYAAYYAPNFQSKRVPLPVFQPWDHYGAVQSGLVTLSRYQSVVAERIQLPGEFPWPTRLFQLDRCVLRQVFTVAGGRELALYNLHLSAYDRDGGLRRQQMDFIRELVKKDYAAGRYVIAGGDWNQLPPGFNWFSLNPTVEETILPPGVGFDFFPPGWNWAYDPAVATVRKSDEVYDAHRSQRSVIDFFLTSPNVRLRRVKTLNQDFRFSDHHPVYLEAELMP
ncbi:endonuclease/exonuclease/phosphatase family metal-dependent hydrolase [Lewinella aquimaris]|uniref:Endonuclease/exonuclease/phosphatase family metal-dependent hydrolase n=1 Tax=Neolewinella aquimaris TaxID=1835722 RepID=A0A840DYA1_9BACT|nr:endonuclease/exonuclease/phosphatase family protein [Neolewinella aquimaris]MBB4077900.1 endonuclease/exonuclease/phosphatase family metal-dependent hydrolase [Neolewinella aquimaris]